MHYAEYKDNCFNKDLRYILNCYSFVGRGMLWLVDIVIVLHISPNFILLL